jgi:hypothetical protein
MVGRDRFRERTVEQNLRQQRLGMDVAAMAEQQEAGNCESEGEWGNETGHGPILSSLRAKRSNPFLHSWRYGLLRR